MASTVIHLRAVQKRNHYTYVSAYCNKTYKNMVRVDLDVFLAVMNTTMDESVLCRNCLKHVRAKGFDKKPEAYHDEQGLKLLSQTDLGDE